MSFVLYDQLLLYEHQSTKNPNIPLRNLFYVSDVYSALTREDFLYGGISVKIPEPKFVVFYNGVESMEEREVLKNKIDMWIDLLNSSSAVTEMIATSKAKSEAAASHLAKSQLVAVQSVRDMEQAYRGVMLFYKNTEADKVNNVTIVNASKEQLTDLDNPRFIDFVARELKQNYDKLDLRQNYSLLAIPGYLGSNKVLEKWAKIAYENKVMLYTDFADLDKPEDVVELFSSSNMASGEAFKKQYLHDLQLAGGTCRIPGNR